MSNKNFASAIVFKDWNLLVNIGTTSREKRKKQVIIVNLRVEVNFSKAMMTDNLEHTLDYSLLYNKIKRALEGSNFNLLEALANKIIKLCFAFKSVKAVYISLEKPNVLGKDCRVMLEVFKKRRA